MPSLYVSVMQVLQMLKSVPEFKGLASLSELEKLCTVELLNNASLKYQESCDAGQMKFLAATVLAFNRVSQNSIDTITRIGLHLPFFPQHSHATLHKASHRQCTDSLFQSYANSQSTCSTVRITESCNISHFNDVGMRIIVASRPFELSLAYVYLYGQCSCAAF